ncbi:hypothetical protein KAR91_03640 [Candidatus Pacearchaeota archaeon]|nr:hypothetical protein [Candidatus Pacearchaeota archaeon]
MPLNSEKHNRASLLALPEMAHIKEALELGAAASRQIGRPMDIMRPIRETPLKAFFDKQEHSMMNMKLNPNIPEIWHRRYGIRIGDIAKTNPVIGGVQMRETVAVPNTLSVLKIFDEIIEGAEPWSDWKQYDRLIDMDTPKVNVPKTQYTDTVGGGNADSINIFKEAGGKPPVIGGKAEPIELDCSNTKNSFRGTVQVERNDVKDNNFLAVEQPLKNAGNMYYFLMGKRQIDNLIATTTTNTATKAALDLPVPIHSEFEALSQVVRSLFPGTQRNRADTMFINPADAWLAIATSTGASGSYPFLSRFILGPTDNKDVVNNSGLAAALGLKNVWETPQIVEGTVMITKRDVAQVTGLREDLTLENFDLSVGGLYNTDLVVRFDVQQSFENGAFKITAFNV